jgi:hypothetical protein
MENMWTAEELRDDRVVAQVIESRADVRRPDTFLLVAIASMVAAATLQLAGHKHVGTAVAPWAPSVLMLGLYVRMVKPNRVPS